jgi:hypothetical protein
MFFFDQRMGGERCEALMTSSMLSAMNLSSLKYPGIGAAFEALLGFNGCEFYTRNVLIEMIDVCFRVKEV